MGIDATRVAEIIVERSDGTTERGSGYLVCTGRVLTVRHVLVAATRVRVRFNADHPDERTEDATVLWPDNATEDTADTRDTATADTPDMAQTPDTAADGDLAVLGVSPHHAVTPAWFGRIDGVGGHVACEAVGFPAFKMREYAAGQGRYRDSHHIRGHIAPLSNRREGTWELVVSAPPAMPEPEWPDPPETSRPQSLLSPASPRGAGLRARHAPRRPDAPTRLSPWAGMSGAAVWVGEYIVGMVSRHYSADGLMMLTAVRADTWAARVGSPARRARLEHLLGTNLGATDLPRAVAPVEPAPPTNPPPATPPPAPVRVIVGAPPGPTRTRTARQWRPGDEIPVGRQTYLLLSDDLANAFVEAVGQPPSHTSQARAMRVTPAHGPGSAYVWLRRIETVGEGALERSVGEPAHDTAARERGVSGAPGPLAREYEALRALSAGLGIPRPVGFVRTGRTETLALAWPTAASGGPCPTLRDRHGPDPDRLDPWRLARFVAAMADLCRTVAKLHARGVTHRALAPEALIVCDNALVLRDLGLAMRPPRRGEASGPYEAPEQRRSHRGAGPPRTATDVHQLAALTYHLITGQAPTPGRTLPVAALAAQVPPGLAEALDAALCAEPGRRPTAIALGAALSAARTELFRGQPR